MSMNRKDRLRELIAYRAAMRLASLQASIMQWGFGEPVWVSADGRVTRYSQLDDMHLVNILRMLRRNGRTNTPQYEALAAEQRRRGIVTYGAPWEYDEGIREREFGDD